MAFKITTASGDTTVDAFRVIRDETIYERRGEHARGATDFVIYGDAGARPTEIIVECEVQQGTVASGMTEISDILTAAKAATSITTPRGLRDVTGVLWHELRHDRLGVTITLAFAPSNATYTDAAATLAGSTTINAGSTSVYAGEGA